MCFLGNQSAFIPDRHIGDNILIADECVTKVVFEAIKGDMTKAYDRMI